jgi:hypothetical protein
MNAGEVLKLEREMWPLFLGNVEHVDAFILEIYFYARVDKKISIKMSY